MLNCLVVCCGSLHRSRGLCSKHYSQWLRSGRVLHSDLAQPNTHKSWRSKLTDEEKEIVTSALARFKMGRKRVVIFTNEGKGKKQRVSASNPVPPFNVVSLFA